MVAPYQNATVKLCCCNLQQFVSSISQKKFYHRGTEVTEKEFGKNIFFFFELCVLRASVVNPSCFSLAPLNQFCWSFCQTGKNL